MARPMTDIATPPPERKSSYDYDDLIRSGHGQLFGPENGRLPLPPMLMLDRIPHVSAEGGAVGKVKFTGQVLQSAKLVTYRLDIKRIISRKLTMAIADGSLSVDGREIYTAEDLRVGLFQSTDNF